MVEKFNFSYILELDDGDGEFMEKWNKGYNSILKDLEKYEETSIDLKIKFV